MADTTPPEVSVDETSRDVDALLSPPDNQLHTVTLADCGVQITDACQGALLPEGSARITCVTSDEPASSSSGGCFDPRHYHPHPHPPAAADIVFIDDTSVDLRATRDENGNGRVYTITFEVFDASGNSAPHTCKVHVRRQPNRPAVDSGPHQTLCRP